MSLRAPAKTHRRNEMQRDRQAIKATATDDRLIARKQRGSKQTRRATVAAPSCEAALCKHAHRASTRSYLSRQRKGRARTATQRRHILFFNRLDDLRC